MEVDPQEPLITFEPQSHSSGNGPQQEEELDELEDLQGRGVMIKEPGDDLEEIKYEDSLAKGWLSDCFLHMEDRHSEDNYHDIPFLKPGFESDDDELLLGFKARPSKKHKSMCLLCYKWFCRDTHLEAHIRRKHPTPYFYKCRVCRKRFLAPFQRARHEKTHKYDLEYPLNFYSPDDGLPLDYYVKNHWRKRLRPAPFTYYYMKELRAMSKAVEEHIWECIQCDNCYKTEDDLYDHYNLRHAFQQCQYCYLTFDNGLSFQKHLSSAHKREPQRNYVGGMWGLLRDLEEVGPILMGAIEEDHGYAKPPDEEGTPKKQSSKRSKRSRKGTVVVKTEPGEEGDITEDGIKMGRRVRRRDNYCKICKIDFFEGEKFVEHMSTTHMGEKPYQCKYCLRRFGTASNRKEHERIHTGVKPYICPICERGFTQISNLKKHISTHGEQNNLKCPTCDKQFIKESSLSLHQRAHSQDRKHKCDICGRGYNYSSLLNRHMRLHTGEMPYECNECGKNFHEALLRDYHIKKVHTGERRKCAYCSKSFILTSDLKKHLKIHLRAGFPLPAEFEDEFDEEDEEGEEEEDFAHLKVPSVTAPVSAPPPPPVKVVSQPPERMEIQVRRLNIGEEILNVHSEAPPESSKGSEQGSKQVESTLEENSIPTIVNCTSTLVPSTSEVVQLSSESESLFLQQIYSVADTGDVPEGTFWTLPAEFTQTHEVSEVGIEI